MKGTMKNDYNQVSGRKISTNTMNNSFKGLERNSNIYKSNNPFLQNDTPKRTRVFAYGEESPYSPSDAYLRDRSSRLVNSYNVPLKNQGKRYVEVEDRQTNQVKRHLLANEMEVVYHDLDDLEDEEDIPDERAPTSELMTPSNRGVRMDSVTNNVLAHSFIVRPPSSHISVSDFSRKNTGSMKNGNILLSSQSSMSSVYNSGVNLSNDFVLQRNHINFMDQRSHDRALFNWEKLFKRCMLEYRRHRLRKAARGIISPSPKTKVQKAKGQNQRLGSHQPRSHQPRRVINYRPIYKFYPCVRFIQRCMKLRKERRSLRYACVPT